MKKISCTFFLIFLFIGFSSAQKNQKSTNELLSNISYKLVLNGDIVQGICENNSRFSLKNIFGNSGPGQIKSPLFNTTFINVGCTTSYTIVSNSTPQNIIQDPNNPDRIHISCISSPPGDTIVYANRKTKYYYSTNRGQSWTFICNVPDIKSGFPVITLTSNGNALIANHSGTPAKTSWYYDAAPGLGSFITLTPTLNMDYIWPRTVSTSNITLTNKFIGIATPNGRDSGFTIIGQSLNSPGVFTQWQFLNSDQAESYSIARGSDGRIGITYHVNDFLSPNDYGSVYFLESTNNGTTYSLPLKIYNANISPTGDSLGALKGIQIIYQGNIPKITFEVFKQTKSGTYFPNAGKTCIRFWSTSLSGSDPNRSIIIADTTLVGYHPYISRNNLHVFGCLCRPTIGVSADGTGLFAAFMVPNNVIYGGLFDTVTFMDVWLTYSMNYGSNWTAPAKIIPGSPLKDRIYPAMSPYNDNTASYYYSNILMLSDSISSSCYYSNPNYVFARVEISRNFTPPSAPVLISPPNGTVNLPLYPSFLWSAVPGATSYRLQISTYPTFANLAIDTIILIANVNLPPGRLNPNTTYYWRVCASNPGGTSPWSLIWNFMTTDVLNINLNKDEIPTEFNLYNIYPNPFNPATKIKFDIPKTSKVVLKIYDLTGREIAKLVNSKLQPGSYEAMWDATAFASGMYFLRLETDTYTGIKKMVFIK